MSHQVTMEPFKAKLLRGESTRWSCSCGQAFGWEPTPRLADSAFRRHRGAAEGWEIRRANARAEGKG